jgi:hypothetical protein
MIITNRVSFTGKDNLRKYARNVKYSYYTYCSVHRVLIRLKEYWRVRKRNYGISLCCTGNRDCWYACLG